MRKSDREITDLREIFSILEQCETVRLGLKGEAYPYVVPLSFGCEAKDGKIILYFHGAGEGRKHDLMKKDNRVCVEADIFRGYRATERSVTTDYKSVIGFGAVERVEDFKEKVKGLNLLLRHCKTEGYSAEECARTPFTAVYKIVLTEITGKQRFKD